MKLKNTSFRTPTRHLHALAWATIMVVVFGFILILNFDNGSGEAVASPVPEPITSKRKKKKRSLMRPKEPEPTGEPLGSLEADLTVRAEKDKPFDIDMFLKPKDTKFKDAVTVFMEQTSQVKYDPRVFTIKPGERKTIKATVLKTNSGLANIVASADNWDDYSTIVITGFNAHLKTNITEAIDSGVTKSFTINLVDNQGSPVQLDSDLELSLTGSNIKLKKPEDTAWQDRLAVTLRENTSSSPALNIQSDTMVADKALISAQLESSDFVVHNADLWIDVKSRWYVPLLMAILGGLVHSVYKIMKESNDPRQPLRSRPFFFRVVITGLLTGVLAGWLAYLLASWGVLGIKVDTTTLQGFVILGFLFSYVGVDMILKAVTNRNPQEDNGPSPDRVPGEPSSNEAA